MLSSRDLRVPEGEDVDVRIANGSVPELYEEIAATAGDMVPAHPGPQIVPSRADADLSGA